MGASEAITIRNKIIAILIKRARLRANKSQRECAELLGCSPSTYAHYEQGRQGLSLPQLEALAYLLEVPVASLWDEDQALSTRASEEPVPVAQMMRLRQKMLAVQFHQRRLEAGLTQAQLADLLGRSSYMVSQYERARADIPLAELELLAERAGGSVADLVDQEILPLGEAERDRQWLAELNELPADVRDFVLKPTNLLYLRIAVLLSAMKADSLRRIAEMLLDITY